MIFSAIAIGDALPKHQRWHLALTKTLRIMRLTVIMLLAAALQVSAHTEAQTVTYTARSAPLIQVLSAIEQQTGYNIFYRKEDLQNIPPVTVQLMATPLQQALETVLSGQPLAFTIQGNTVAISRKMPGELPGKNISVSGIVYNETGQPLSGANVIIKATRKGTITNAKGEFVLAAVPENSLLVISFIGYAQQEVKVSEGKVIQVYLNVAKNELDKVVVQAYGKTTQRLATGNITTVTGAEIERQPVMNPLEALMGKVPGLVVTQTSGYNSAPVGLEIRGKANLLTNSDPLIVIDGIPSFLNGLGNGGQIGDIPNVAGGNVISGPAGGQSPIFAINPSDIESITVLKDADATAIYGSKGANGVVIITTKHGKPGKTNFEISANEGITEVTNHYQLLSTKQYLEVRREAFKNDGITPTVSNAYDLLVWDTTQDRDWQKLLWGGVGKVTDLQTSLSGGDKFNTFRISGGYRRQTTMFSYSGADQRLSTQLNFNHISQNQRLKASVSNIFSYTHSDLINTPSSIIRPPDAPEIFDANGNLNYSGWAPVPDLFPFSQLLQPYNSKTYNLNTRLDLAYELLNGLSVSTNAGYANTNLYNSSTIPIVSQDPNTNPKGNANFGTGTKSNVIIEPQINYKRLIGNGQLTALLGGSYQSIAQAARNVFGFGYTNDNLLNSVTGATSTVSYDGATQYKYLALFGRANYNWRNKYILNTSIRRDGSSRFGNGHQFGNFWSVGAAWIFTEEKWLKNNISFLSFGKLRGSYGLTGGDIIPDYEYLTTWSANNIRPYQSTPAYVPTKLANPDLHWQTNRKLELAMDLGFFKDRIYIQFDVYRNICGDQLVQQTLPDITGFNGVSVNFPATIQNTGIEAIVTAKLIDKKDLDWSLKLSASHNHNKLTAFPGLEQSSYAGSFFIGQSLNTAQLLHYLGVDPQTGLYTVEDKNKDGVITNYYNNNNNDLYPKDLTLSLDGGFSSDLTYKGLTVNLFFNFRKQVTRSAFIGQAPGKIANQSVSVLDRWQKPGDIARFARFTTGSNLANTYYLYSDGIYSDGSYIRLKNASISYALPRKWIDKCKISNLSVFIYGQNLFIITRYNGVDPDAPAFGGLPPQKIFTGGLKVTF